MQKEEHTDTILGYTGNQLYVISFKDDRARHPRPSEIPGPDGTTPQKIWSRGLILPNSGDGLVRDPGNGSDRDLGSFLLGHVLFYSLGLYFDSREMIFINLH